MPAGGRWYAERRNASISPTPALTDPAVDSHALILDS